ncbi:MAG TPA: sigma-70 family RNA polymerase sigma factor [Gaiellaceae bacterium]|nr:sigma-70 family RNA polymerase sigma factor [Gaiellaceae bacterium]
MSRLATPAPTADTATLFDRHHQRIYAYCLGQLRDRQEADDAVQSTFLYAHQLLERGEQPRAELPWLYTIAHNVCRTRRRALQRRSRVESAVDLDTLHDTVGRPDPAREELAGLGASLAALPATQRNALLLREWRGLSYAEIAARLELSESAVETVLFRARRNLARRLQRTASRVGSISSIAFLVRGLRRTASGATATKTVATVVALGVVAGAAVHPVGGHPHPAAQVGLAVVSPARTHVAHAAATHRVAAHAPAVSNAPVRSVALAPAAPILPAALAPDPGPASPTPASPSDGAVPAGPVPAEQEPSAAPPAATPAAAAPDPAPSIVQAVGDAARQATGDVTSALPPPVQSVVSSATAPVQQAVDAAQSVVTTVATLPSQLPSLSPEGTLPRGRP